MATPRWLRARVTRLLAALIEVSLHARGTAATRTALEREGELWRAAVGLTHAHRTSTLGVMRKAWFAASDDVPPLQIAPVFSVDPAPVDELCAAVLRAAAVRARGPLEVRARAALLMLCCVATGRLNDVRCARLALGNLDQDPVGLHVALLDMVLTELESGAVDVTAGLKHVDDLLEVQGRAEGAARRLVLRDRRHAEEYLTCDDDGPISMRVEGLPRTPRRKKRAVLTSEDLFAP